MAGDDKLPAMQFYPGDWRRDLGVQSLDYATRGIWFELICLMHGSEERGALVLNGKPMPEEALCCALGISKDALTGALTTLLTRGVASRRESDGAIINRRMVRDEETRKTNRDNGKKGGNPNLKAKNNPSDNGGVNPPDNLNPTPGVKRKPTPSSSSSSSNSSSRRRGKKVNLDGIPDDLLTYLNDVGIGLNNTLADALRESDIALVDAQRLLVECNKDLGRWCREVIDGTWQEALSGDPAMQVNYRGETPEQEKAREKREEEARLAKKKKEADDLAAQRAYEATPEGAAKLAEANAQLAAVKEQLRLRSLQPEVEKPRPPSYHTQFLRLKKDGEEAA